MDPVNYPPRTSRPTPQPPQRGGIIVLIIFAALVLLWQSAGLITDWFWFQELRYEQVFTVSLLAKALVGLAYGGGFALIFFINLYLADRLSPKTPAFYPDGVIPFPIQRLPEHPLKGIILGAAIILGLLTGTQAATHWESILCFLNASPFGLNDPVFGRDIGFYVFKLPFLEQLYGWLMTTLVMTTLATGMIYLMRRALLFIPPKTVDLAPAARTHLLILAALIFTAATFGFWLNQAQLLNVKRGVVFGPGYTDVTTQIWVLKALMALCPLCAATLVFTIFRRTWRVPAAMVLIFLGVLILGRGIYPNFVQRFKVIPNEIALEKPYLERNIKFTRTAYNLDAIEDRVFPAQDNLTAADLQRNDLTIKNIRLWDHTPLLRTFAQIQEIRTYYKFIDVDNDRYTIDGEYRQVMLSPRELSYDALPSRTWVNEHLTYTHGYGAVMGPVNRITPEGLPEFFIKDIPPASSTDVKVTRPEIYFGEQSNEYVFVKTKRPEFDYPVGDKNVYNRYAGSGGVPVNFLRKVLFAVRFNALTILLSNDINAESRVMYFRNVKERVARIAPFARFDADPYLVVSPQGRLLWFLDGYTTTSRFPYSEPVPRMGNYIRNSIKAVVDAYDGTVLLYASDATDPILKTYAKIFPGVFKPLSAMPAGLQLHLRYPQGLMAIQARMFLAYHMQDPQVFYNKEDLWAIPSRSLQGDEQEMEPYFTIMRLPKEKKEEFILLLPFTPRNKNNMAAWMAARCDAPHYGKVIVYNFPKQKLVYGPGQIDARIDQDTEISKQLSLWNQSGSQVLRGSLLAIPIEESILYVQALYLAAQKSQLPELKRVIAAYGNSIAMEENLDKALARLFGNELNLEKALSPAPQATTGETTLAQTGRQMAIEALARYRKAQDMLRKGDWSGYGAELKEMEKILSALENRP